MRYGQRWRLGGARAVVTGGTKGIGLATAAELLELGATVLTVARRDTSLPPNLAAAERDGRLSVVIADVATRDGRARLVDAATNAFPALEILVNNVGTNIRKPSIAFNDDEYAAVVETNQTSVWDVSRGLYPLLKASGAGSIVNVGSVAGIRSVGSGAVYAMTKAAIAHLTRYLSTEWAADGIRVNAVSPWYTRTPLAAPVLDQPDVLDAIVARTPLGRIAAPEDVAGVIAFLCLPAAAYVTGQEIAVDGGMSVYAFKPRV